MTKTESTAVKDWLWMYRDDLRESRRIAEELRQVIEIQEEAKAFTYDGMPGGSRGENDLSTLMVLRERYEEKLKAVQKDMARHLEERLRVIDGLRSPAQREVISLRYIQMDQGRPRGWQDIAMITGFSRQYVYDIHGKALEAIRSHIERKEENKKK